MLSTLDPITSEKRRGLLGNAGPRNMEHVEDKASGRVCLGRQVFGHKGCNYCSVSLEFVYGSDTDDTQARLVEVSCHSSPWRGQLAMDQQLHLADFKDERPIQKQHVGCRLGTVSRLGNQ